MAKRRQTSLNDPDLLARLWNNVTLSWRLLLDRRVSGRAKLIPLAALLYLFSPIDFLPEIAFGPLGALDDIGVLLLALQMFINSAPKEVLQQYRGRVPPAGGPRAARRPANSEGPVIEGRYEVRDEDR